MSDIAINPVTRRVQFTGNTGTGPYAFTFNILVDGDIAVFKGTTELTLTTDYTVSINANGTGSITLTAALIASDVLTIIGGRELSRTTDFVTAGDLLASSLNEQLDSNVIMTQQLDEKLGRGLFVNPGDVFTDLELPLKDDRKGTVLGFNETTGDPEPGPTLSDVDSLATISADIKTLAEIQDGTVATDAITNVNTIRTDVTTVSGISSNVTTVAGNTSNINTVAGNNANITTVAGINSDVTTVSGISSDVTTVAADGADIGVVAGLSSDITTVSGISTEIGRLGTADAVSDMNALSPAAVIADMDSLADNVSAISIVSDDIGYVIAVAINAANINTVAADGADIGTVAGDISNVNTVATNITSVNTNATNITDIQNASANAATATTQAGIATTQAGIATTKASEASASEVAAEAAKVAAEAALDEFTDIYLGAKASDPTTDNDGNALTAGDQYFNTTINVLKIYNGSAWQAAAIDSSGFVETTGDTMTGNLSFGDNDKAIFGAGSDLQIYHNGTHSYIEEQYAAGSMFIRGSSMRIQNTGGTLDYIRASDGTDVKLYYNGDEKLATTSTGVDIFGTLTSDGLTVDGADTEATGSQLLKVRNSSTGEAATIGLYAKADNGGDGNSGSITFDAGADGSAADNQLRFNADHQTSTNPALSIAGNGDISFYEDTGTTPKFFWDASAERLGIGTSSPSYRLDLGTVSNGTTLFNVTNGSNSNLRFKVENGVSTIMNTGGSGALAFTSGGTTESMRITSSGNVGIGTSSPSNALHVNSGTTNQAAIFESSDAIVQVAFADNSTATYFPAIGAAGQDIFLKGGGSASRHMTITSAGDVGIGTSSPSDTLHVNSGTANEVARFESTDGTAYLSIMDNNTSSSLQGIGSAGDSLTFYANSGERMRIDSSGNVGIGTSSPDDKLHVYSSSSLDHIRVDGPAGINRNINFATAGSTRWNIYANSTAESGSNAGSNLSFGRYTDAGAYNGVAMLIERSSGNVGIGTSSPSRNLTLNSSGTTTLQITNDTVGTTTADGFQIKQYTSGAVQLWGYENSYMAFATNNTERMRIDSSGNLLVGKTSANNTTAGTTIYGSAPGNMSLVRDGGSSLVMNRLNSDGDIAVFRKNGSTVGSIGNNGGDVYIGTGVSGLLFLDGDPSITPHNTSANTANDSAIDIGRSTRRFKDLYLSGGVFLGGTGAANQLDDYEEGTFTPTLVWAQGSAPTSGQTLSGSYTKVGRLVTVTAQIYYNGSTVTPVVGTDVIGIGSLPFVGTAAGHDFWGDTGAGVQTDGAGMYNSAAWSAIIFPTSPSSIFMKCISVDGSVAYDDPINITITYTTSS